MPKVVLDTNVFISATIFKGSSQILIELWKQEKFVFLFSAEIFDEYFRVLSRSKFKIPQTEIQQLAELLTQDAILITPQEKLNVVIEDPSDNKFLECAIEGKADFIVSGDRHLLNLKKYKKIRILKISEFLRELE